MTDPPPPREVRSSESVREQLDDLSRVVALAAARNPTDFAGRQHLRSMERHRDRLRSELRAALLLESAADAELLFEGGPVRGTQIEAGFLGPFVNTLQKLANAVGQAVTGSPTSRAPVPRNVAAEARVLLAAAVPGSYGIRFRFPTGEELGQMLGTSAPEILRVLQAVFEQTVPDDEARAVVALPRVRAHYAAMFRLLAASGASATLRTREAPHGTVVAPSQARDRLEWIELVQSTEREFSFRGVLVGGSLSRRRFELDDGSEQYAGRATEEAVRQMRGIGMGDHVTARIREINVEHEDEAGDPSQSFVLERIEANFDF